MSLRVISKEEELENRKRDFKNLEKGSLFNLSNRKYYITVKKDEKNNSVTVVELNKDNIKNILDGKAVKYKALSFENMCCLNLITD